MFCAKFSIIHIHAKLLSMNYLCRICGEPEFNKYEYNYFQELSCIRCQEWVDEVMQYTRDKIIKACGSYAMFTLLAQVDSYNTSMFN